MSDYFYQLVYTSKPWKGEDGNSKEWRRDRQKREAGRVGAREFGNPATIIYGIDLPQHTVVHHHAAIFSSVKRFHRATARDTPNPFSSRPV